MQLSKEIGQRLRVDGGLDIEMPLRLTVLADRQAQTSGQQWVGEEIVHVDLPVGYSEVKMRADRFEESSVDAGSRGDGGAARNPQHPCGTVDRLGDGDREVETDLVDGNGLVNDAEVVSGRMLADLGGVSGRRLYASTVAHRHPRGQPSRRASPTRESHRRSSAPRFRPAESSRECSGHRPGA